MGITNIKTNIKYNANKNKYNIQYKKLKADFLSG